VGEYDWGESQLGRVGWGGGVSAGRVGAMLRQTGRYIIRLQ
jgi:hypothetical protein